MHPPSAPSSSSLTRERKRERESEGERLEERLGARGKGRGWGGMKGSTQPCLSLPALYFLSKSEKHLTRAGLGPGPARAAANLSRAAFTLRKIRGGGHFSTPPRGRGGHFSTHSLPPFQHHTPQPLTPPPVPILLPHTPLFFSLSLSGRLGASWGSSPPKGRRRGSQWHFATITCSHS
jgi:hypothetical protein